MCPYEETLRPVQLRTLHPDFSGDGDVLIMCGAEGSTQVGFRAMSTMLQMASPILAGHITQSPISFTSKGPTRVLYTADSVHDMHAFLRLLRLGSPPSLSRDTPPPPFDPTVPQVAGIHRLVQRYPGWYSSAVLDFHVELHASDIIDGVGRNARKPEIFALLHLAHDLASARLWAEVCDRLRRGWWHATLNPWAFGDRDVQALGDSIHSLLSILAAVSSRDGLFSNLDELCVLYAENGEVSVAAAERGSHPCCPCWSKEAH